MSKAWFDDDDPDAPRPRPWGTTDPFEISRRHFEPVERFPASDRPAVPLADLFGPLPPPARPQRAPAPEPEPTPRLEIVVMTDDGVPVDGAAFHVNDEFGQDRKSVV